MFSVHRFVRYLTDYTSVPPQPVDSDRGVSGGGAPDDHGVCGRSMGARAAMHTPQRFPQGDCRGGGVDRRGSRRRRSDRCSPACGRKGVGPGESTHYMLGLPIARTPRYCGWALGGGHPCGPVRCFAVHTASPVLGPHRALPATFHVPTPDHPHLGNHAFEVHPCA